jgi:hypothetical protein
VASGVLVGRGNRSEVGREATAFMLQGASSCGVRSFLVARLPVRMAPLDSYVLEGGKLEQQRHRRSWKFTEAADSKSRAEAVDTSRPASHDLRERSTMRIVLGCTGPVSGGFAGIVVCNRFSWNTE